ncbi:MAG: hypothetical protein U1F20_04795 [Lysobacterales bacterium]
MLTSGKASAPADQLPFMRRPVLDRAQFPQQVHAAVGLGDVASAQSPRQVAQAFGEAPRAGARRAVFRRPESRCRRRPDASSARRSASKRPWKPYMRPSGDGPQK